MIPQDSIIIVIIKQQQDWFYHNALKIQQQELHFVVEYAIALLFVRFLFFLWCVYFLVFLSKEQFEPFRLKVLQIHLMNMFKHLEWNLKYVIY